MASISTQKEIRELQRLPFCYLCGQALLNTDAVNRDHVPPRSIFKPVDKNFPLILRTHASCNSRQLLFDEIIGQLVSLLHDKKPKHNRLDIKIFVSDDGNIKTGIFDKADLEHLIFRWIRSFHSALYHSYLPDDTKFYIQTPFPSGERVGNEIILDKIQPVYQKCLELLDFNISQMNYDSINTNNGKLLFYSVWSNFDNGGFGCFFQLKLYDWENLGDQKNFQKLRCIGIYQAIDGKIPQNATSALRP